MMTDTTEQDKVRDALDLAQQIAPRDAAPMEKRQTVLPADRKPETSLSIVEMSGDDLGELFGALAEAQAEFGSIERTLTAKIASRKGEGSSFSYDYAPLDEVLNAVRPALAKHGIAVMQFPHTRLMGNQTAVVVRTMLGHKSGQWMRNDLVMGSVSTAPQDIGGAITYARRYALQALLGISPDHDDDAAGATGRDQQAVRKADASPSDPATRSGVERVKIISTRKVKLGGADAWQIKTSAGECFTDDATVHDVLVAAMRAEQVVGVVPEKRAGRDGRGYTWVVEVVK